MWIENNQTKQLIDLNKISCIHTYDYDNDYDVNFTSYDMGHSQTWRFKSVAEKDNALQHIINLLKPTVIDATQAPLKLE
jgi:hypothetical protein